MVIEILWNQLEFPFSSMIYIHITVLVSKFFFFGIPEIAMKTVYFE